MKSLLLTGPVLTRYFQNSFQRMIDRFGLNSKGLIPIAEIKHDIGLKDDKYGRQEAAGLNILKGKKLTDYPSR